MRTLSNTHCANCPAYYQHIMAAPEELRGKMLHYGDRVCTHGKKVRRFGKRDPKVQVPDWCPRRISPPRLRIYDFRSTYDWAFQTILKLSPLAHRYCVLYEGTIELSAKTFWSQCNKDRYGNPLPIHVPLSGIVEIDDGIQPVCFYRTDKGYELLEGFDTVAARGNQRRDASES